MSILLTIPKFLQGRTVAILATGESLTAEDVAIVRDSGVFTVAVSDAYKLAPWADALYSTDGRWWLHHAQAVHKLPGLKLTQDESVSFSWVYCVPASGERGFDENPARLRHGNNSGYAAMHAVAHAGPRRILLLGFDCKGSHFFGEHPRGLRTTDPKTFPRWIRNFTEVAPVYAGMGIEVVDCSPDGALTCFRKSTVREELQC